MYRSLKDKDIQNMVTAMAMYALADMKNVEEKYNISWIWERITCIYRFQKRFDTDEDFNRLLDIQFRESLHAACQKHGIPKEREKQMIESSGWNWNWKEDMEQ